MSGFLDVVGDTELWSQTDFTQGSDFTLDVESIESHIDGLFDTAQWDVEDTAVIKEPPRTIRRKSRVCNGPRLLPKIRLQDQILEPVTPTKHDPRKGRRPFNAPLAQHANYTKTVQSANLTANDGLYGDSAQQVCSQEHLQEVTPPVPALDLTSSITPEDHNNSFPSIYGSFSNSRYDQVNDPYLANDLSSFPLYNDHYDLTPTRKSLQTMPPSYPSIYPSARPRAMQALAQNSYWSSHQMPTPMGILQSQYSQIVPVKKTTLLQYLSLPNPALGLVLPENIPPSVRDSYWWFDVRNVRPWSDFNLETMLDMPELRTLLESGVPCDDLPTPRRVGLKPLEPEHVHLAHRDHYATKLNAALKASSTQPSLQIRSNENGIPSISADFLSSVSTSPSGGDHVVGIVLCYKQWDSSMRNGNPILRVEYLRGLARLQHALREHGCRYGFIITEIELVCVRYGGDEVIAQQAQPGFDFSHNKSSDFIPIFGYFEVSPAITLSHNYKYPDRHPKMTAGLALWYLHIQASDTPLPGHLHWKLFIGTPEAMTRQKYLERDGWVPSKINTREKREVELLRGWVLPEDKLNQKREVKKRKRPIIDKGLK
jgi:hypothetical protein